MLTRLATNAFLDKLDQSIGIKVNDLNSRDTKFKLDTGKLHTFSDGDDSWSDDLSLLKKAKTITVNEIFTTFTTLRLVNVGIKEIDVNFSSFQHLKELNLSGNLLSHIDNIPSQVEILDLNANVLRDFPNLSNLCNLVHLGISYNDISLVPSTHLPRSLISLDLAYNQISDLKSLVSNLDQIKLKTLCLIGNLVDLAPAYRSYAISKLPLSILDDISVKANTDFREEDAFKLYLVGQVESLTGVKIPESTCPDIPSDEFKYSVILEFPTHAFSTAFVSASSDILEFPTQSSTGTFEFPISTQLYKDFKQGIMIKLFQEKTRYIQDSSSDKSMPASAKTKDKKKPSITYTPSTSEPILLDSKCVDLSLLLSKKQLTSDLIMVPSDDYKLKVSWTIRS